MRQGIGWRILYSIAPALEIGLLLAAVAYGAAIIEKTSPAPAAWCDWNRVFPEPDLYYCDGVLIMPPYNPGYGKNPIIWVQP